MKHEARGLSGFLPDRKAELAFKQVMFMFVRVFILIILFLSIVYVTKKYIIVTDDIEDTEADILLRSLMTNKNSVIYYDEGIGRVYPYIIDAEKFTGDADTELENVFNFGKGQRVMAARLTLFDSNGDKYLYKNMALEPVYINKQYFSTWLAMARTRFPGPGGVFEKTKSYYVNVMDSGELKPGIIEISVVLPNS
jgi:hypothetical protein